MRKAELVTANEKLRKQNAILKTALNSVRQTARDVIPKGSNINPVWVVELVTIALVKEELQ